MKRYSKIIAETLKIGGICLILDILHTDMQSMDGEMRDMHLRTAGKKFQ